MYEEEYLLLDKFILLFIFLKVKFYLCTKKYRKGEKDED